MNEQCRVVKVTYSEELATDSEIWLQRLIEKTLLEHVSKSDLKLRSVLISEKDNERI
ncbi:hypothetical protein [Evansella halocellulosilytica]|uniref:hypothetical protein n=1 Tax=Evansella halocellulosilytica TaxID=2011013 RepID=UPI0015C83E36|nr:hypothetical protein [Evansella halocellulosilytica]